MSPQHILLSFWMYMVELKSNSQNINILMQPYSIKVNFCEREVDVNHWFSLMIWKNYSLPFFSLSFLKFYDKESPFVQAAKDHTIKEHKILLFVTSELSVLGLRTKRENETLLQNFIIFTILLNCVYLQLKYDIWETKAPSNKDITHCGLNILIVKKFNRF